MVIGVPKELKDHETRVGLTPAGVRELVEHGHTVICETRAGENSYHSDEEYRRAGAEIASGANEVWERAAMVVKVKEPIPAEYGRLHPGLVLFCYLHLAPLPELTRALRDRQVAGVAYETVRNAQGGLPLLEPMSEVAGRMAVQVGASYLQRTHGGRGVLLGGVPGVPPARVVVIGGGIVGVNAARIALGMGASVVIIERDLGRCRWLDDLFGGRAMTLASNSYNLANSIEQADLAIGAVLIPGGSAPKLVTEAMVKSMRPGSVIVDVAIDQGGCIETAHPTTHSDPAFIIHGVVHYCVTNMPAAVPRTSTFALTNATQAYILRLADMGLEKAAAGDPGLAEGINTYRGQVVHPAVAAAQKLPAHTFAALSS